ncbi:MAG: fused MFS/spermidine synthase [Pirellulales bacterium]|nr:fused MFS/spermidine synthase [Pirellulales bacterium]
MPAVPALTKPAALREPAVPLGLVMLVFFTSGVPALVYQLVWQRILALHSGVGIYSVAMIVAAFMAGLGIGSLAGGLISERLTRRRALQGFALVELGIGAFAAASIWLYYDVLYLRAGWLYETSWSIALAHFLALLPPTTLMGMSLPLLVRAMVTDPTAAPRQIGLLYGVNGLGAAAGAIITPWLLIRLWGIQGAVSAGMALNLLAGIAALALGALFSRATSATQVHETAGTACTAGVIERLPLAWWCMLYATSGFCALGLEIVWFRLIDTAVKSTAFTFGTVLGIYLIGLSTGSVAGALYAPRLQRPLQAFLLCQSCLALYTVALICAVVYLPAHTAGLEWYVQYWTSTEPFNPDPMLSGPDFAQRLARLYVVLPLVVLGVPTFLMGLSFTILQRAVQDDEQTSGRNVGLLQAANIAGSTAGSLVVGLVALDAGGTAGTLRLLTLLGVLFAGLGLRIQRSRQVFALLATALLIGFWALPGQDGLWRRWHGIDRQHPAQFAEDASGIVALRFESASRTWTMFVNGKSHSELPYRRPLGDGGHMLLGVLPTVIHPDPREIAVIGLGSGATAWGAGCRPSVERLRVFEICAPEIELVRAVAERERYPELRQFLADKRVELQIVDGRNGVADGTARYDIIEADATRPSSAYSGHLYSVEFFRQCRARLKPGGLMCSWAPTRRTFATFCEVFPHVLAVRDDAIVIGSNEPLAFDAAAILARLRDPSVRLYLGAANSDLVASAICETHLGCEAIYAGSSTNGDLQPLDEFGHPDRHGLAYALLKQAIDAISVGQADVAAERLARAQAILPDSPLTCWVAAREAALRNHFESMCQLLDEALAAAPCYAQAQFDRAMLAVQMQDPEAMNLHVPRAAELMPGNPTALYVLGCWERDRGDRLKAIDALRRSQEFGPSYYDSAQALARILLTGAPSPGEAEEALHWAEIASQRSQQSLPVIEETLGQALLANGRHAEAVQVLERLMSLCQRMGDRDALRRAEQLLTKARQNGAGE